MSVLEITTLENPITATVEIPGSKSYTNRALIMAVLTRGSVILHNPLYSEDTEAMIEALRTLTLHIETFPHQIIVHGDISMIPDRSYELSAKDSGTTLRFLLACLSVSPGTQVIRGNERLSERPIKDLVDALRQLGAKIDYLEKEEQLPLKVHSSTLSYGSDILMDASMSSQFLSAMLMISPLLNGLKLSLIKELISKPYVDMTIAMMQEWGITVVGAETNYYICPGQRYQKESYVIEGDFSSAGYFFAIGAITRSTITLKNLNPHSLQADRKFLGILEQMGNEIKMGENEITIIGKQIHPINIDMEDCPDQVQTVAVLAAFAKGITKISGVRSLRLKETERVQALKNELLKMGIQTEDTYDTLTIYGGNPHSAIIDTYGDHRMAMAFAVAGTKLPGMRICNEEVVNKTFPAFWDTLSIL